jgi:hypothetical protein
MMQAREDARARIAARLEEARRGIPVAQEAAQAVTGASARVATTLAEERAYGLGRYGWWPGRSVAARAGGCTTGRAVSAVSLPRRAARAVALEASAPHRTPRPGEGRAT